MKMTLNRIALFASFVLVVAVGLRVYWAQFTPAQKWLYVAEQPAREYAVAAMREAVQPELPEALAQSTATVHDGYVTFSPRDDPTLLLAFSVGGPPPPPGDGRTWVPVEGSWYVLSGE